MSTEDKAIGPSCFPMKNLFGSKRQASFVEKTRLRLDDKVAVITGAASGIGAATARLFVSQGARVIIADVKAEAGRKLSSELGSSAHFFLCDVTKEADVAAAVDYAVECWGRLDIMFNNAGVPGPLAGLADIDMAKFDHVMAVHIKGAVLGVKHASRVMIPAGKGVILFSGSTSAKLGGAGPPLHSAANAAVLCIVRSAAAELVRHGIRVNAVSPHCVATPMSIATINATLNPRKEITVEQFEKVLAATTKLDVLTTEKVASAVMFLASDDAGFISGHNLVLDGGFSVTKQFDSADFKAALQKSIAIERQSPAQSPNRSPIRAPLRPREGGGGNSKLSASLAKEREIDDKGREREQGLEFNTGEKAEKGTQKDESEKEREKMKQKLEKDREKKEKERERTEREKKMEEEKARAKQEKARAKEEKARVKDAKGVTASGKETEVPDKEDPKTQPAYEDMHPLDKKAAAKEERMQNAGIELPNAGPEPDIPFEFQPRPPVRKLGRLFSRGKESKDSKNSEKEKNTEDKSTTDPSKASNKQKEVNKKSTNSGKGKREDKSSNPENGKKEDKSNNQGKGKKEEDKSSNPEKLSKMDDQGAGSKAPNLGRGSKKEAKSPSDKEEITQTPQSKPKQQSPMQRIGSFFSFGKNSKKKAKKVSWGEDTKEDGGEEDKSMDAGNGSKKEKKQDKSAASPGRNSKNGALGKVSTKEAVKSPAREEKAQPTSKNSAKTTTPSSPEITPEVQPKQAPLMGSLLSWGVDPTKKKDKSAAPGKESKK
ncbi:unnamed protein product [Calypogeia fissa]